MTNPKLISTQLISTTKEHSEDAIITHTRKIEGIEQKNLKEFSENDNNSENNKIFTSEKNPNNF